MRQRCIAHKLRNISNKLNDGGQTEIMPVIKNVYTQTDIEIAKMISMKIIDESDKMFSGRSGQLSELHEVSGRASQIYQNHKFIRENI